MLVEIKADTMAVTKYIYIPKSAAWGCCHPWFHFIAHCTKANGDPPPIISSNQQHVWPLGGCLPVDSPAFSAVAPHCPVFTECSLLLSWPLRHYHTNCVPHWFLLDVPSNVTQYFLALASVQRMTQLFTLYQLQWQFQHLITDPFTSEVRMFINIPQPLQQSSALGKQKGSLLSLQFISC